MSETGGVNARKKKQRFGMDNLELALLGLPVVVWFVLFAYLPMFGIIIAFKRYRPGGSNFFDSLFKSEWMRFDNFSFLFKTPDAFIIVRNTVLYNLVFIFTGVLVSVTLAVMISLLHSPKLAKTCQTMMFLPHFLSWVVVGYFVFAFLSVDKGLVNQILKGLGHKPIQWYTQAQYWPGLLVAVNIWKGMGYSMVVYLASITGIDASLYEAAAIDGGTKWQQVKHITLPLLTPIITIMLILAVGRIFSSDFGLFYNVPRRSGPLYDVTQTIDVYVYNALTQRNNIGFAAAASVTQSIVGLFTIVGANQLVRRLNPESSLF